MGTLSFHGSSATKAYASTFLWPRPLVSFPQLQLQAQCLDTKVLDVAHNLCRKSTKIQKSFSQKTHACVCKPRHTHLLEQTYVYLTLLWSLSNKVHLFGASRRTREKEAWCEEPWAIREGTPHHLRKVL